MVEEWVKDPTAVVRVTAAAQIQSLAQKLPHHALGAAILKTNKQGVPGRGSVVNESN